MKKYNKNRFLILTLLVCILCIGCSAEKNKEEKKISKKEEAAVSEEEASIAPYGRYPQLVTYTLGKMIAENNSNMPEGDTYENNVYTRYLREMLNIQNKNTFEAGGNLYNNMVSMAITDKELPDIMIVQDLNTLKELAKKDMIADLTQSYDTCASYKIKQIYKSYGGSVLDAVTMDGKLMAIPGTNIRNGPNLLWLRKDWMDKLGLEAPESLEEAEEIVRRFVEEDPGENGKGQTVGLVFDADNTGNADRCYQLDLIFSFFGAHPGKWIKNKEGDVSYGSVGEEAKEALAHLQTLYYENVLDPQFLVRTSANIDELIMSGRCGSFFGPWWAANNPLMNAYERNSSIDWQPYLIPTEKDGSITTVTPDDTNKYIVVRKGFKHPEIAIKIINVLFDYTRYVDMNNKDILNYYAINVDPTARPLAVNVDYSDALARTTENVKAALLGERDKETLITIERSYYDICKSYLERIDNPLPAEWAAYTSRIKTVDLLSSVKVNYIDTVYGGETFTMQKEGWNLDLLEKKAYLKIISGEVDISYFDTFVEEWRQQGGDKIENEWEDVE